MDSADACGNQFFNPETNQNSNLSKTFAEEWLSYVKSVQWEDYKNWLFRNKHKHYAGNIYRLTTRTYELAFSNDLVLMENSRRKEEILRALSNLSRYLDIKYDTYFHEKFLHWLKRKEVKWKCVQNSNLNYSFANSVPIEQIIHNLNKIPQKYRLFAQFVLVSGLRTEEAMNAFNNHDKLCNGEIIEMFWDRKTKKSNAVFCHPLLHNKINYKISKNMIHKYISTKKIGCQVRYLRKINFTLVATKIDPLLAEFMQGRRGNISQRHYFLPLMTNNREKWIKIWKSTLL